MITNRHTSRWGQLLFPLPDVNVVDFLAQLSARGSSAQPITFRKPYTLHMTHVHMYVHL